MTLKWNDLFLSGSIVDLATSKWRARVRITAADLGIANSDAVNKALALGTHRLAPADAFERINEIHSKTRRTVDYHSRPFRFVRGARYVPSGNLKALGEELMQLNRDFAAAVDAFVANYDTIKAEMAPVIKEALQEAARTPEAAAEAFDRLMAEYPSPEVVRAKFSLEWSVYEIQGAKKEGAAVALQDETEAVRGVVRDMVRELRNEVTEKLADVLTLIQKGGKLQPRSIESALAVLDHVDSVNVLGDDALSAQVESLRRSLKGIDPEQRVSDSAIVGLEGIKQALTADIEEAVAAAERNLTSVGRRKLRAV